MTFRLDPEGDKALLRELATGFAELGDEVAGAISQAAPFKSGRYRRSIHATTFLDNQIVSGPAVHGTGVQSKAQIWTAVYSTSPLAHLLEFGTRPHDIPIDVSHGPLAQIVIHHPGSRRFPHFWTGFASVLPRAGSIIAGASKLRGRVNERVL